MDYLFETSWEVCNKVGGIYTVVKTKAPAMTEKYSDYFLVGPYIEDKADKEFERKDPPEFLKKAFDDMHDKGVNCFYGKWLTEGEPNVILVDFKNLDRDTNHMKQWLWDNYQIDSLNSSWDFDEPLRWSWTVGILMDNITRYIGKKKAVLHCHEWMAGFALLYVKKHSGKMKTVFTTHATMLGRTLAGNGVNLYEILDSIDPAEKAAKYKVQDKYTTERACANEADVFTTVSEITGIEAEKLLGKKPDVLLNNGLNVDDFPTIEDGSVRHIENRDIVREFLTYYFFPYYTFSLEHTLNYFMVSRYEFKNKGMDIIIDGLARLNAELIKKKSEKTIVMFFWVPMSNKGILPELVESKNKYVQIKSKLEQHKEKIMTKLLRDAVSGSCSVEESIFASEYLQKMKNEIKHFKKEGNPPLCTHELISYDDDAIISALRDAGLNNAEKDRVKVIVYPVYLDGADNLLNLSYYDALSSGHLGLFPSYYEPWGYTPPESMSVSVPAVTTDLAGFGRFIKPHVLDKNPGVFVLERQGKTREEIVEGLYKIMSEFASYDHAERVKNKINAKQMSELADWKHFVKNYDKAYKKALK